MAIKTMRFLTIILAALNLGMAFSHLLQLPPRMNYDPAFWINTTQTLFPLFATIGAPIEIGSIIAAIVLAYLLRKRRPVFQFTLIGAALLIVAQVIWWLFVAPANAVIATWTPSSFPMDWTEWRAQWEYTHAARAILQLLGLCSLVTSVLVETSEDIASETVAGRTRFSEVDHRT